jgi:hypothetical protein
MDFRGSPWSKVQSPKSKVQSLGSAFKVQSSRFKVRGSPPLALLLLIALLSCLACKTAAPLPKVNLQEPGWTVRQGQAVWHLEHGTREIAGDLVIANAPDDRSFVQFSKSPFPLVIAQSNASQWAVEFPPRNKHYAGRGHPPLRLIWLYLPRVLAGKPPPTGWIWRRDNTEWHLENPSTGESLEGYFDS